MTPNPHPLPEQPEPPLPEISYPYAAPPSGAELAEVAPGIFWMRIPMPYALNHVNVYLLRTDSGWLIVDTGLHSEASLALWDEVLTGPLKGEPVLGVCCTHYHADHAGLAGHLTERLRAPLYMSYQEYFTLRGWPMDLKEVNWRHAQYLQRAGFPRDRWQESLVMFDFSEEVVPLPPAFNRLTPGSFAAAGSGWEVLFGGGHAPEHALFYAREREILISGDQLLPRISSNVSVSMVNPEDEPMSAWLATLEKLNRLPNHVLVLPGHGLPFRGVRRRVAELQAHHEMRFQSVLDALSGEGKTGFEITQSMFPMYLAPFELQLALGEALAHARYLEAQGKVEAKLGPDGALRYRRI